MVGFDEVTVVPTTFTFTALLANSNIGFSWFQAVGLSHDLLQSCISKIPPSIDFLCSFTDILKKDFISVSKFKPLRKDSPSKVCDYDHSKISNLNRKQQVNSILLGFFRSALKDLFDYAYVWDPANGDAFALFGAVNDSIPSLPFDLSDLKDCTFFISKLGGHSCRVLIVPNCVNPSCVFLCEMIQVSRPPTEIVEKSSAIKFGSIENLSSTDGTIFIKGTCAGKKPLVPTSPISPSPTTEYAWCQSWDDEWVPQIKFCYKSSLVKAVYFALLSSEKIYSADLDRGITSLKSFQIIVDLSNFALLVSLSRVNTAALHQQYQQILAKDFTRVSPNVYEDVPTALLFQKAGKSEGFSDILAASCNPVFISISSLTLKFGDSFSGNCIVELPIVFPGTPDFSMFPLQNEQLKVELVLEIFSTAGAQKDMSNSQQISLLNLKNGIERLTFEFILTYLLEERNDLVFTDALINYVNFDIFRKTLEQPVPLDNTSHFSAEIVELVLISPSCIYFMKDDLDKFLCMGKFFKRSQDLFYAVAKADAPFWSVLEIVSPTSVLVRLFCSSDNKKMIIEDAFKSISLCVQRANQRFLMQELTETHTSRDLIDPKFQSKSEDKRNDPVLHQLACPLVFSKWFPVHWRIKPSVALQSIISTLEPLCITNQQNTLIFSELFYMVFEHSVDGDETLKAEASSLSFDFEGAPKISDKGITLKVYGLDIPGNEIVVNFVKLVENKIENLVQNVVGTYISRNPTARLTKADIEFLIPPDKLPTYQTTYLLVKELENPHLFLVLLRQAFLLFLSPYSGSQIDSFLAGYCLKRFGKSVKVEKEPGVVNILNVGDLAFLYNFVARKRLTILESKVGEGLATVILTPFDGENNILFPSTAHASLGSTRDIILEDDRFQIQQTADEVVANDWSGYKVAVTMWTHGSLHLESLLDRIALAFKFTLVDYGVESYFRSSKWYMIGKKLPMLPPSNQSTMTNSTNISLNNAKVVLSLLPEILRTGAERMNPVIQSFTVSSKLPLDTIAIGIRGILTDIDMEAIFFVKDKETGMFRALTNMLSGDYGTEYVIIGSSDIFTDPVRKMSLASEVTVDSHESQRIPRFSSLDSMDSDLEKFGSKSNEGGGIEEIFMFPDSFYPPFPVYGRRSSFFVVSLSADNVLVSTYKY